MLDVRDFGAIGDGVTDDRAAIQSTIDAAVAQFTGGIRSPQAHTASPAAKVAVGRLTCAALPISPSPGTGPHLSSSSLTRLPLPVIGTFLVRDGSRRVTFSHLAIDGNRSGLTAPDEQTHGIESAAPIGYVPDRTGGPRLAVKS